MSEAEVQDALDELQGKWQPVVNRAMNDTTFGGVTRASFGLYDDKPKDETMMEGALTIPQTIGAILGATAVAVLAVALMIYVLGKSRQSRRLRGPPDSASPDTTYAMSDIQDSTKLWESLPAEAMGTSVRLHFDCLRAALKECHGYLSYTEGDGMFAAFHSVQDAVKWALLVQERLLELPWPTELLGHPSGREESRRDLSSTGGTIEPAPPGAPALFRGLRVRIGIHRSGGAAGATSQEKNSSKVSYSGFAPSLTRVVCDAGVGGAITITGSSFRELETIESAAPFHCGEYRFDVCSAAGETVQEQVVLLTPPALSERVVSSGRREPGGGRCRRRLTRGAPCRRTTSRGRSKRARSSRSTAWMPRKATSRCALCTSQGWTPSWPGTERRRKPPWRRCDTVRARRGPARLARPAGTDGDRRRRPTARPDRSVPAPPRGARWVRVRKPARLLLRVVLDETGRGTLRDRGAGVSDGRGLER